MYHLRVPTTEQDFYDYYYFRWKMLRKPLNQPLGSEKDAYDAVAHHQMVIDELGKPVAIGRLYITADNEASIQFLAVKPELYRQRLGSMIAMTLESIARQEGVKRIVCSVREQALDFFIKLGFISQGEITEPKLTHVKHFLMVKPIETADDIIYRPEDCKELQKIWYRTIPLSGKIGIRIEQYTGTEFTTTMSEAGNLNPHNTLFAGSLFSLGTLTGWGLLWLMMRETGQEGVIIMVDAHIRYSKPIKGKPAAIAHVASVKGDFTRLKQQQKTVIELDIALFSRDNCRKQTDALLSATFMITPPLPAVKNVIVDQLPSKLIDSEVTG